MAYNLIDVPGKKLDDIINLNIEKSEKIIIIVSFIFEKGLNLSLRFKSGSKSSRNFF